MVVILIVVGWSVLDFVLKENEPTDKATESNETKDQKQKTKNVEDSKEIAKEVDENQEIGLKVGDLAPNIELSTIGEEQRKLSDFRGQPVIINFWTSSCSSCRVEMPDMEKFYQDYDVAFFSINLTHEETKEKNIQSFIDEHNLTFPIMLDEDGEIGELYNLDTLPETYIINETGHIF